VIALRIDQGAARPAKIREFVNPANSLIQNDSRIDVFFGALDANEGSWRARHPDLGQLPEVTVRFPLF
jgi:hypothetical protein